MLFTTPFTHLCFCRGGSDVFRESDKGYFSPTLSCYFPGSFVWLRGLGLSVLRGTRGTFEPRALVNTPGLVHRLLPYLSASLCVCVCVCHLVLGLRKYIPEVNSCPFQTTLYAFNSTIHSYTIMFWFIIIKLKRQNEKKEMTCIDLKFDAADFIVLKQKVWCLF